MYHSNPTYDHSMKIVIIGDAEAGKSCLTNKYTDTSSSLCDDTYEATIGVEFATKTMTCTNGRKVKQQIWDTAGKLAYRSITACYFGGATDLLIAVDLSNPIVPDEIRAWIDFAKKQATARSTSASNTLPPIYLVGTKADIAAENNTLDDQSKLLAKLALQHGCKAHFICSAKTNQGVEALFSTIAETHATTLQANAEVEAKTMSADNAILEAEAVRQFVDAYWQVCQATCFPWLRHFGWNANTLTASSAISTTSQQAKPSTSLDEIIQHALTARRFCFFNSRSANVIEKTFNCKVKFAEDMQSLRNKIIASVSSSSKRPH